MDLADDRGDWLQGLDYGLPITSDGLLPEPLQFQLSDELLSSYGLPSIPRTLTTEAGGNTSLSPNNGLLGPPTGNPSIPSDFWLNEELWAGFDAFTHIPLPSQLPQPEELRVSKKRGQLPRPTRIEPSHLQLLTADLQATKTPIRTLASTINDQSPELEPRPSVIYPTTRTIPTCSPRSTT